MEVSILKTSFVFIGIFIVLLGKDADLRPGIWIGLLCESVLCCPLTFYIGCSLVFAAAWDPIWDISTWIVIRSQRMFLYSYIYKKYLSPQPWIFFQEISPPRYLSYKEHFLYFLAGDLDSCLNMKIVYYVVLDLASSWSSNLLFALLCTINFQLCSKKSQLFTKRTNDHRFPEPARFFVRIQLDEEELERSLQFGAICQFQGILATWLRVFVQSWFVELA